MHLNHVAAFVQDRVDLYLPLNACLPRQRRIFGRHLNNCPWRLHAATDSDRTGFCYRCHRLGCCAQHSAEHSPITPPIWPPGTPPTTPPRLSDSSGASLISAICLGITVGANSLPAEMNLARDGAALMTAVVAGGGGGGGGGGATSIAAAYCLMLMVSVKKRPMRMGVVSTTACVRMETASFHAREPVLNRFSSRSTACENLKDRKSVV